MRCAVLVLLGAVWSACGHHDAAPAAGSATPGSAGGSAAPATGTGSGSSGSAGGGAVVAGPADAAVMPTPVDAAPIEPPDPTLGVNLALAALGGHVVSPVSVDDPTVRASNLIDGFPVIRGIGEIPTSLGWVSDVATFPQAIVLGFRQDREATISAVVIDTAADANVDDPAGVPKDVEIQVSTSSATDGFTTVAKASLPPRAGESLIKLPPTKARWVKVVLASTHGNVPPKLGELQVIEATGAPSLAADLEKNLLLPALGGRLVRFTSQVDDSPAAELVDGATGDKVGWSSAPEIAGQPAHLPQELTFAFRDDRPAMIDHLVIDPTSGMKFYSGPLPNVTTWPKTVEVQSSDHPLAGFTTLTTVTLPPTPKPVRVPIGAQVRYLRLRIVENHGGDRVTLGEVQAIEGVAPGGRSILVGRSTPLDRAGVATSGGQEVAARREREPNDTAKQADKIDTPAAIGGALTPDGDHDVFLLPGGAAKQTITVAIEGQPAIRTKVALRDAQGTALYAFDPARAAGTHARFSLSTGPGDVLLEVTQPPSAQVVIWDTSGSMEKKLPDLDAALHGYLKLVRPVDRVQLIRFDNNIEVLLKDFSSDSAKLLAALENKVYADGGTSIYDAIRKGVEVLDPVAGNRAIVMMTDGEDTTSVAGPPQLWQALDAGRVHVYTIGLGNGLRNYVARAGATAERVLADVAESTGGRYTHVVEPAQLGDLYAAIGAELRAPATYALAARTSSATGTLAVRATGDRLAVVPRVELVLDASGSMKRPAGPRTMMEAAKGVLTELVARLPADARVGLRVYGQRIPERQAGDCQDSQLVVPFGPLDRKKLTTTIKAVRALGTTPIAYSIKAAGEDLKAGTGPAMLIVVTDGREECKGDPAAEVAALRTAGLDVTLNIVGFSLTDAGDRDAMTKVASAGGGTFFDARDEAGLRTAVDQAMAVPYVVTDVAGTVVGHGVVGAAPIQVPEGELSVRLQTAGAPLVIDHVAVAAGQASLVELKKDGDDVGVHITGGRP